MNKAIAIILVLVTVFTLPACGKSETAAEMPRPAETAQPAAAPSPAGPAEKTLAEEPEPAATSELPELPAAEETIPEASKADAVDVDLTLLSSTMVYSEVYAMVYEPQKYIGKTVKMKGLFSAFEGKTGQIYYSCIVQDATACCAQGLEFELNGKYRYPDDYPEPGSEITVIGTFDTYKEEYDGNYYLYLILRDAELV